MTGGPTIGLLGGSFNPAHGGHLHISREALKRFGLDRVWWLVTPHNPLKQKHELASYGERLATARKVAAADRRIVVTDIEAKLGTTYTIDTLRALQKRYPGTRFVWLMGADNLSIFHKWKQWDKIFGAVPVAVLDRAPYSHSALRAPAALRFARLRLSAGCIRGLGRRFPPAWVYVHMRRDPTSATAIRSGSAEKTWKKARSGA